MIEIFFIVLLGFFIFAIFLNKLSRRLELQDAIEDAIVKRVHLVKVEKHGADFFWYDVETDMFIAQGKTVPDFIEVLKNVHPSKVFIYKNFVFAGPDFDPVQIDSSQPIENIL